MVSCETILKLSTVLNLKQRTHFGLVSCEPVKLELYVKF